MKCLFVIDVQNGFISSRTSHIIPFITQLINDFKDGEIIATKFINADKSPYEVFINWERLKVSPETDLLPQVQEKANLIVEKNIYSACTEEVLEYLRVNKINEVFLAGIDTDCCVLKTATDLFEHGIRPIVLTDYCASNGGPTSHDAAITVLKRTIGNRQIVSGKFPST